MGLGYLSTFIYILVYAFTLFSLMFILKYFIVVCIIKM